MLLSGGCVVVGGVVIKGYLLVNVTTLEVVKNSTGKAPVATSATPAAAAFATTTVATTHE